MISHCLLVMRFFFEKKSRHTVVKYIVVNRNILAGLGNNYNKIIEFLIKIQMYFLK